MLVTEMSGSGKSTVLTALTSRGHRVVDTLAPGWIVETETNGGPAPVWGIEQVTALIDGHRAGWLFGRRPRGESRRVYDRFDAVVLLSAPVEAVLDRVDDRPNPFGCGGRPDEDRQRPGGVRAAAACRRGSGDPDHDTRR